MPMRLRRLVDGDEPIPPEGELMLFWLEAIDRLQNAEAGTGELIQPRDIACALQRCCSPARVRGARHTRSRRLVSSGHP